MQIRESAATQTEVAAATGSKDGTTEFPTLRCLFTLFSWAWKPAFPTRLVNKIPTRYFCFVILISVKIKIDKNAALKHFRSGMRVASISMSLPALE